jgi:hypothetical protein
MTVLFYQTAQAGGTTGVSLKTTGGVQNSFQKAIPVNGEQQGAKTVT